MAAHPHPTQGHRHCSTSAKTSSNWSSCLHSCPLQSILHMATKAILKKQMGSSFLAQGVKDRMSLLWHRFNPWPGNFHMPWVWLKNKIPKFDDFCTYDLPCLTMTLQGLAPVSLLPSLTRLFLIAHNDPAKGSIFCSSNMLTTGPLHLTSLCPRCYSHNTTHSSFFLD